MLMDVEFYCNGTTTVDWCHLLSYSVFGLLTRAVCARPFQCVPEALQKRTAREILPVQMAFKHKEPKGLSCSWSLDHPPRSEKRMIPSTLPPLIPPRRIDRALSASSQRQTSSSSVPGTLCLLIAGCQCRFLQELNKDTQAVVWTS